MEQTNVAPVVAKKIWNIVRTMYFLLRKGIISKGKLMADLNLMMKRGKIASKAIHNLMFHHNSNPHNLNVHAPYSQREYEFSCSNSPVFFKHKHNHHHANFFSCVHASETIDDLAVKKALKILNNTDVAASPASWAYSEAPSPALPGFGKSPMPVRQLRITDSPFPVNYMEGDCHVDEAAEKFISKFYNDLRRQNKMTPRSR